LTGSAGYFLTILGVAWPQNQYIFGNQKLMFRKLFNLFNWIHVDILWANPVARGLLNVIRKLIFNAVRDLAIRIYVLILLNGYI